MKKADWIFALGAIAVILFFVGLSQFAGRKPLPLPATPEHQSAKTRTACLVCHDPKQPGAVKPIASDHPLAWKDEKFNCIACHKPAKE